MSTDEWWRIYGPFKPGEDGLPHLGQVIRHYSKLQGYKTRELADRLSQLGWKVGERRMEQLQSDDNISHPQEISRRKLLARTLAIPPILLGLSHMSEVIHAAEVALPTAVKQVHIDTDSLLRYESLLATYWDSFYTGSVRRNADGIRLWQQHLEKLARDVDQSHRTHALTLLCRFDQLLAVVTRDNADYLSAMHYHNQSVRLAKELGNAELIAASLFRRAKTRLHEARMDKAMADMTEAVSYARHARDNLRGYVFQMAGELVTRLPATPETAMQFNRFMDGAGRILRKGPTEDDGSGAQFNQAGYFQDRARGCLRLHKTEDALEAIALAEKAQPPQMIRWQVELLALRAEAYLLSGEPEWACHLIEDALPLANTTQSVAKKQKLVEVYDVAAARYPNEPRVRQLRSLVKA
jgi:tetratricopeptide (TPR) repeat protein